MTIKQQPPIQSTKTITSSISSIPSNNMLRIDKILECKNNNNMTIKNNIKQKKQDAKMGIEPKLWQAIGSQT